ncbi:MAG TPA: DUF2169 domain-containing protein, partial [Polyangium sp.]|nr:DUF2169 domain-containing protein [Polyangium sp.]
MEIVSHCPLLVASRPYRTVRGARFVLVICKGTFQLTPSTATFGAAPEPIHEIDQRWDDKPDRSVFAPSDIVPFKRDADVVLVGHAFAPGGQPARSIMTRLCVGDVDKCVEVFGDRLYTPHGELRDGPKISRARLRYERAVGGPGTTNPVGMRHDKKDLFGSIAMASLQPPGLHVTRPDELSEPVGYGPIAPDWPTRTSRLGHWAATFSPTHWFDDALPDDIDPSFFNVAPPDQRLREIRPDERIVLEGLMADQPRFVTQLPSLLPQAVVERVNGKRDPLRLRADTLWIDTNRRLCTVTWRASLALTQPADTGRIVVTLGAPETSRVFARIDPALLAMPMPSTGPDAGATVSVNLHGKSRPVTPFDPQTIAAPETFDLPDDPAFMEDDAITFVQDDDVKTATLPFVASPHASNDRHSNVPQAAVDKALPFAAPVRAPSSPGLPFAPPPAPASGARDLPFSTPPNPATPFDSAVFPVPPRPPIAPPPLAPPSRPPITPPQMVAPPAPPAPVGPPVAARDLPFVTPSSSSRPSEPPTFPSRSISSP